MSINEWVTQKASKVERKTVLKELIKTAHIYNHLHACAQSHTNIHTHRNNLEGIPNYRQMYSLILLQHFIIEGCDLHWNVVGFFAVVLIVYCGLIKACLSLTMISALCRWRQCWETWQSGDREQKSMTEGERERKKDPCEVCSLSC